MSLHRFALLGALGAGISAWLYSSRKLKYELPKDLYWAQVGGDVPFALAMLYCQLLAKDAFASDGIFRKAGNADTISECEEQVCRGVKVNASVSEHVLANVMKRVVEQELLSPPLDAFADILDAADATSGLADMSDDEVSAMLIKRIKNERDRSIFTVVLDVIAQTVEQKHTNRMNLKNCAITIGPRLCSDTLFMRAVMNPTVLVALLSRLVRWRNAESFRDHFRSAKRQQLIQFSEALATEGYSIRSIGWIQSQEEMKELMTRMASHGVRGGFAVQLRRTIQHCQSHTVHWPPVPASLECDSEQLHKSGRSKSATGSAHATAPTISLK